MSTLVVEPNPGGHRFQAVANVARLALADGDVVLLTSAGAAEREEFATFLGELPIAVEERFGDAVPSTGELAAAIRDMSAERLVRRVVVMEADNTLKTWWYVGPRALRGLRPRPQVVFFLTRWPGRLRRGVTDLYFVRVRLAKVLLVLMARCTRSLDRCSGFAGRDEAVPGWVVKNARDPVNCIAHSRDRAALRQALSLPAERRLVGIFGGINRRKDPGLALQAVLQSGSDADLLLAGPVAAETATWLAGLPDEERRRVIVRDEFLSNEALDQHMAASDVVLLLMHLEGPSGIMGKAIAADVPVVTAGSKTRERELAALHHGAAVEPTSDGLATALRRVLDTRATRQAEPANLPTAETFGGTVLGLPDADPALRSPWRRGVGFRDRVARSVANRARHLGLAAYLRPRTNAKLARLGSDYGGWWVPEDAVRPGAVAYLGGAGEDITFDLALHERGCVVRIFDPTPRAISYVEEHRPDSDRFLFLPVGLWDAEETLEFFAPPDARFVSHSAVNLRGTQPAFKAPVKPMHQLMREIGDSRVDIVKLDIEGAEHRTLADIVENGPTPEVLCVEFDQPQPLRQIVRRVRDLRRAGYRLAKVEGWNYTFLRDD